MTLGDKGVVFGNRKTGQIDYIPAKKVNVVDTTVRSEFITNRIHQNHFSFVI